MKFLVYGGVHNADVINFISQVLFRKNPARFVETTSCDVASPFKLDERQRDHVEKVTNGAFLAEALEMESVVCSNLNSELPLYEIAE